MNTQQTNTDDLVNAMVMLRRRLEIIQVMTERKRTDLQVLARQQMEQIESGIRMNRLWTPVWPKAEDVLVTLETVDHVNRVVDKFIQVMDAAMETLMVERHQSILPKDVS